MKDINGNGHRMGEVMREGVRRVRRRNLNLLPLQRRATVQHHRFSSTCCYCDFKIPASLYSQTLSRIGTRHAHSLRLWFSIGVGFTLTALVGVTIILLFQLKPNPNPLSHLLFGFSSEVYAFFNLSLFDAAYLLVSTLISVSVHEFGHALAAASEGIQTEYISIFLFALVFPGALVAFNFDLLQALSPFAALRVYCAGIWHNAACCAVCGLLLLLLPFILFPFYIHGESPMILDVPSSSPLSGYLSPGDVIVSLDGVWIHSAQEWMEMIVTIDKQNVQITNQSTFSQGFGTVANNKGYCVPSSMREESLKIQLVDKQSACPRDLTAFLTIHCFDPSKMDDVGIEDGQSDTRDGGLCLNAKDVVKLDKCGDGWLTALTNGSSCICRQDESCLSPVLLPGWMWVEITYLSPYSQKCSHLGNNTVPVSNTSMEHKCGGTFVFVGDVISMAHSVILTSYQPRWAFAFGACLPNSLERCLVCTFHVSLTLALLNSLPVYFLDGESILETTLCHFTSLNPRKRRKVLQICLFGGTVISILAFLRIFVNFL
ncbi:Peptidase_M50 domain-containing protein [Cephalotus follicularis]|uniref:Endopeptidase S2P n=1 Tax=Cephalotus follicularis TaxID=3775 RepID=A0A1Q3BTK3_CEPFO|nr:Peptidase_M50 domain-containing protein [Cephalotus follicularis]